MSLHVHKYLKIENADEIEVINKMHTISQIWILIYLFDKGQMSLFEKGPKCRLPSRIDFTKCRSIVEEALQSYCKQRCKKENVGLHAFNDWKNEFLRIIDIRIENFTKHPYLYKQPTSRSVKSLKIKMEKLHSKYVFAPAYKAANNVIII